jgi:uncharacterized protein
MLALRPLCENCSISLPYNATNAMICSFECTFCQACVTQELNNVCPNCGGGFTPRPIRPKEKLDKNPASTIEVYRPVDKKKFEALKLKNQDLPPQNR